MRHQVFCQAVGYVCATFSEGFHICLKTTQQTQAQAEPEEILRSTQEPELAALTDRSACLV